MSKNRAKIDMAEIQRVYDKHLADDACSGRAKTRVWAIRFMQKHRKDLGF